MLCVFLQRVHILVSITWNYDSIMYYNALNDAHSCSNSTELGGRVIRLTWGPVYLFHISLFNHYSVVYNCVLGA